MHAGCFRDRFANGPRAALFLRRRPRAFRYGAGPGLGRDRGGQRLVAARGVVEVADGLRFARRRDAQSSPLALRRRQNFCGFDTIMHRVAQAPAQRRRRVFTSLFHSITRGTQAPLDLFECSFRGTFSITSRQAAPRGPDATQNPTDHTARDAQGSRDHMAGRVDDPTDRLAHNWHVPQRRADAVDDRPGPIRDTTDSRPRPLVNSIDDVARAVAQTFGDVRGLPPRHAVDDARGYCFSTMRDTIYN
mmetsp:Transcript_18581/g.52893  ORF Transcript_18581/g.52893 Transcript_18581/m.52893 type:complete len:247 (+) Transcript_18581:92-832(+)